MVYIYHFSSILFCQSKIPLLLLQNCLALYNFLFHLLKQKQFDLLLIIAFYNILRLLKENVKFEDLILEMETNRTETIPFGFFAINPFCVKKMFSSYGICFERFFSLSRLEKTREDGTIFLLTFWNDPKNWFRGAHTVAVRDRKTFFEVYNRNNQRKTVAKITDVSNICGNKALICGYRLWKEK